LFGAVLEIVASAVLLEAHVPVAVVLNSSWLPEAEQAPPPVYLACAVKSSV
jgi:hypothetical protein